MSYAMIGLQNPKNAINAGAAMRACSCYEAAAMAIAGQRFKRASTDTTAAFNRIPVFQVDDLRSVIPYNCVPVAVDLIEGAIALPEYEHPKNAFYIFGPEDGTLGHKVTEWCRDVIYIPTSHCMNLAATVNVVLYDRLSKRKDR